MVLLCGVDVAGDSPVSLWPLLLWATKISDVGCCCLSYCDEQLTSSLFFPKRWKSTRLFFYPFGKGHLQHIYISIAKVPDIPICHEMKQESGRHTPDVLTHCLWEELSCPGNPKQSQNPQCFPTPFAWLLPFREESLPFKERAWSVSNSAQGNWG